MHVGLSASIDKQNLFRARFSVSTACHKFAHILKANLYNMTLQIALALKDARAMHFAKYQFVGHVLSDCSRITLKYLLLFRTEICIYIFIMQGCAIITFYKRNYIIILKAPSEPKKIISFIHVIGQTQVSIFFFICCISWRSMLFIPWPQRLRDTSTFTGFSLRISDAATVGLAIRQHAHDARDDRPEARLQTLPRPKTLWRKKKKKKKRGNDYI